MFRTRVLIVFCAKCFSGNQIKIIKLACEYPSRTMYRFFVVPSVGKHKNLAKVTTVSIFSKLRFS